MSTYLNLCLLVVNQDLAHCLHLILALKVIKLILLLNPLFPLLFLPQLGSSSLPLALLILVHFQISKMPLSHSWCSFFLLQKFDPPFCAVLSLVLMKFPLGHLNHLHLINDPEDRFSWWSLVKPLLALRKMWSCLKLSWITWLTLNFWFSFKEIL